MAVQDPYAYPGTDVLINIPGFTDPEGWKKAETTVQALEHDPGVVARAVTVQHESCSPEDFDEGL